LRLKDWGAYVCSAVNEVGSSQKVFFVSVFELPSIVSRFENVTIFTKETRTVKCESAGSPDPEVYWTFDGAKIKDGLEITFESTMSSGQYSCVAENSVGSSSRSFWFSAVNKPSIMQNQEELKKEIKSREGDSLELLCPFENFKEVRWRYENGSIDNFTHESIENRLKLTKLDRFASGEWSCNASNSAGSETFAYNVTVLASPVIRASWNLNDRVSEFLVTESDIDEKTLKVGESLKLTCAAEGFPKPKVIWRKGTDTIAEGETLLVENLQFHHSDIYTCSAENEQGSVKKFFKVDVVSPPQVADSEVQKSHLKAIGESLMLNCRMFGNPQPNVFWFKDK
jgi:Immunoglobulin domain